MRLLALLLVLLIPLVSSAQQAGSSKDFAKLTNDELLETMIHSLFLTADCEIPYIQPWLCEITSVPTTSESQLVKLFFGSEDKVHSKEMIRNALWGEGTRIKSGYTILVGPEEMTIQQAIAGFGKEIEMVPAYLDVFMGGFAYRNNVPHQPVYVSVHKPTSFIDPVIKYEYVYEPAEGAIAAEALIAEMFEELSLPDSFQSSVEAFVLDKGERLFQYKATPQYLTTFTIYEGGDFNEVYEKVVDSSGRIVPIPASEAPVAVPILDRFVRVILDGNKMLAGLDYFWDADLKPIGQPKEVIKASEAMLIAKESIFEYFGGEPPLITVREVKLGFIQSRKSPHRLIPVWMFDASYAQTNSQGNQASGQITQYTESSVLVSIPFAVNALTREPFLL